MAPPPSSPGTYRIARASLHHHVSDAVVSGLEDEVSQVTGWRIDESASPLVQKYARLCTRRSWPYWSWYRSDASTFMVMMGPARIPLNAAEWLATRGKRVAWLFDAWPNSYEDLLLFTDIYRLDKVFVTAKQSARYLNEVSTTPVFQWCPEPLVDFGFRTKPWHDRHIDLLHFGRRYERYHKAFTEGLNGDGIKYMCEPQSGKSVFPTTAEFVEGLTSAKICVCFPRSLTHPEYAGNVSTLTQRYLQCMASACLMIGSSPDEMIELMGYDPVVPADMDDPARQIRSILAEPERYHPLIERNLQEVARHTVTVRLESILAALP